METRVLPDGAVYIRAPFLAAMAGDAPWPLGDLGDKWMYLDADALAAEAGDGFDIDMGRVTGTPVTGPQDFLARLTGLFGVGADAAA